MDLARIASRIATPLKVVRVELTSFDDGMASFDVWGELNGQDFVGSYSQDMTSRDSPEWQLDEGPDPSDDSNLFYEMQQGIYNSDAFKNINVASRVASNVTVAAVTVTEATKPIIRISDGQNSIDLDMTTDAVHHLGEPDVIVWVEGMNDARALVDAIAMGRLNFNDLDEVEDADRDVEMYGSMDMPDFLKSLPQPNNG